MEEKSSVRSLTEKNIIIIFVISEEVVDEGSSGLLVNLKRARDNPTTPRDGLRGRTTCKSLQLEEWAVLTLLQSYVPIHLLFLPNYTLYVNLR